jgi:hypothetical protein
MSDPTGTHAAHPMLAVLLPPREVRSAADATGTQAAHPIPVALPPPRGPKAGAL